MIKSVTGVDVTEAAPASRAPSRIVFLDGLRGLAIFFVMMFHAFVRWHSLVPYQDEFMRFPLFEYGFLGVELFFLISGFVILLTLRKCDKFSTFMLRRWLRLFPASLIVSVGVFATAWLFPERPAGAPALLDLVPGLLFIHPEWLGYLYGHKGFLEGAYWSLYVEVVFYVVFGSLFFIVGEARAIAILVGLFLVALAGKLLGVAFIDKISSTNDLGLIYFGWFMTGALIYRWTLRKQRSDLLFALALGAACPLAVVPFGELGGGIGPNIGALFVVLLFFAAAFSRRMQAILTNRILVFLGFVSYPLYLLHENIMVSLIIKIGRLAPWLPAILLPAIPMAIVVFLGWVVARFAEPAVRSWLRRPYELLCQWVGATLPARARPATD